MNINFLQKNESIPEFGGASPIYYLENTENKLALDEKTAIGKFKKINFFVGANNSGKSRFLRGLFKLKDALLVQTENDKTLDYLVSEINFREFYRVINRIHSSYVFHGLADHIDKINLFLNIVRANDKSLFDRYREFNSKKSLFDEFIWLYEEILKNIPNLPANKHDLKKDYEFIREKSLLVIDLKRVVEYDVTQKSKAKFYIPILRSLVKSQNLQPATFDKIIEENYGIDSGVFSGLDLYNDIRSKKSSPSANRKKVKEFEKFLSKTFFEGKEVEITPNENNPVSILFSVDDLEFPIFDIGDGIQMLILLLFPIFTAEDNCWVFIEEPESHLHPGLQRVFLQTLLTDEFLSSKKLRYFFTTHSNHFLDLSLDFEQVSIFQFNKLDKDKFVIKSAKPNNEILELLGINTSSVFLSNSSIWVEGPTDRKYLSRLLRAYTEKNNLSPLKEDIDFAFFEYGGNLIEHYLFDDKFDENLEDEVRNKINSFALSNRIYLLADNDNAKGKKLLRQQKLESLSKGGNFRYQNTEVKEIENLLSVKIIKQFLPKLLSSGSADTKDVKFKREEYLSKGLGEFLERLLSKNGFQDIKKFKSKTGGTLSTPYKNLLCDFVINSDFTYSDFIEDNKQLEAIIVDLFKFIKRSNPQT